MFSEHLKGNDRAHVCMTTIGEGAYQLQRKIIGKPIPIIPTISMPRRFKLLKEDMSRRKRGIK